MSSMRAYVNIYKKNTFTHSHGMWCRPVSERTRQARLRFSPHTYATVLHAKQLLRANLSRVRLRVRVQVRGVRLARAHRPPSSTTMNRHKCPNYGPTPWPSFFSSSPSCEHTRLHVKLCAYTEEYMLIRQNCGTRLTMYLY